jgi:hypothetical protein
MTPKKTLVLRTETIRVIAKDTLVEVVGGKSNLVCEGPCAAKSVLRDYC